MFSTRSVQKVSAGRSLCEEVRACTAAGSNLSVPSSLRKAVFTAGKSAARERESTLQAAQIPVCVAAAVPLCASALIKRASP